MAFWMNFTASAKNAAFARLLDHHLQFLNGTHERVTLDWGHAQSRDDFVGNAIQKVDGPRKGVQERS